MNDDRRKDIQRALTLIGQAKDILVVATTQEQDDYDNILIDKRRALIMARTIILAWVIGVLGLVMIGGGIWGLIDLFRQEVRAPLKSYGGAVSMVCGGVAMLGMAQGLRLLLVLIVLAHH